MPSRPCSQFCRVGKLLHEQIQEQHNTEEPSSRHLSRRTITIITVIVSVAFVISAFLVFFFLWLHRHMYKPSSRRRNTAVVQQYDDEVSRKLHRFSYRELKRATCNFNDSQKLGKGGYGVVYRGLLRNGKEVAVKKLVLSSVQGEREFQNELSICSKFDSRYVVKLLGFSSHGEKVRLLVYECMQNRSLQETLLEKNASVHLDWVKRFSIILDIARALAYLHTECNPPVIHGDVKPSNVLLDKSFCAYLADFGLARVKDQKVDGDQVDMEIGTPESCYHRTGRSQLGIGEDDRKQGKASMAEADQLSLPSSYLGSPHSAVVRFSADLQEAAPDRSLSLPVEIATMAAAQYQILSPRPVEINSPVTTPMEVDATVDHAIPSLPARRAPQKSGSKDWWWKQEHSGDLQVRDYVMEWMRSELSEKKDGDGDLGKSTEKQQQGQDLAMAETEMQRKKKKHEARRKKRRAMEEEQQQRKEQEDEAVRKRERAKARAASGRKSREWWKDEYFAELSRKTAKKSKVAEASRHRESATTDPQRRWRDTTAAPTGSMTPMATDITAASDDVSSTTSMRGTVCYVAPEFGGAGALSEASDIYSFGVLLLVIISGRRPIDLAASYGTAQSAAGSGPGSSPATIRRFERANLITWARSLAYSGNLLELVDDRLQGSYPKEQVQLCISLALLCIRRLPSLRPNIATVLKILLGEVAVPALPIEFSPSPPSRFSLHQSPLRAPSMVSSSDDIPG